MLKQIENCEILHNMTNPGPDSKRIKTCRKREEEEDAGSNGGARWCAGALPASWSVRAVICNQLHCELISDISHCWDNCLSLTRLPDLGKKAKDFLSLSINLFEAF